MVDGWKKVQVQDICTKWSSNIAQNKIEDNFGDYPLYGASGFLKNIDFYHQENPYIGIVKDGSGVGRVSFYPGKSSLLGTLQYILPKPGYDIRFVGYALKSLKLSSYATGAAIPHIYFKDYGKDFVSVPSTLEEQQSVVAELDLINDIIDAKNKQLNDYEMLKTSLFYEIFGNPVANERGWEVRSLKDICSKLYAGGDVPRGRLSKEKTSIFCIPILSNGKGASALYGYTDVARESSPAITISGRGTIGYSAVQTEPFFPIVRLIVAVPLPVVNIIYLQKHLSLMSFESTGGAIPQLTIPMIKDRKIVIPPLSLQEEYSKRISFIDTQINNICRSLRDTEMILQSRMEYWFN